MTGTDRSRPKIGVTLSVRRNFWIWMMHRWAIWRAGGEAVKITARNPRDLGGLDGLTVGGGDDISLQFDGAELNPNIRYDPDRDALEKGLIEEALKKDLPLMGICRGAQMINIVLGGTLFNDVKDIAPDYRNRRTVMPRKSVKFEPGSRLAKIMRCNPCRVNALHHQAVNKPGDGMQIVGRDEHEIVQAIENPSKPFLVGVQWHPELLPFSPPHRRIYAALIDAARTVRDT